MSQSVILVSKEQHYTAARDLAAALQTVCTAYAAVKKEREFGMIFDEEMMVEKQGALKQGLILRMNDAGHPLEIATPFGTYRFMFEAWGKIPSVMLRSQFDAYEESRNSGEYAIRRMGKIILPEPIFELSGSKEITYKDQILEWKRLGREYQKTKSLPALRMVFLSRDKLLAGVHDGRVDEDDLHNGLFCFPCDLLDFSDREQARRDYGPIFGDDTEEGDRCLHIIKMAAHLADKQQRATWKVSTAQSPYLMCSRLNGLLEVNGYTQLPVPKEEYDDTLHHIHRQLLKSRQNLRAFR